MTLRIMVKSPDGKLCKALTHEQFDLVHDHFVQQMNAGRAIKDDVVRTMLHKAGKPIDFTVDAEPVPVRKRR
jgi:hypothetical protein